MFSDRQETDVEVQWTGIFNVHGLCLSGPSSYWQEQESACCSAPHHGHRARWYLWLLRHCMSFPISQSHLDVLSPVSWELKSTARQWDEIKWQELIKVKGLFVCFWYFSADGDKARTAANTRSFQESIDCVFEKQRWDNLPSCVDTSGMFPSLKLSYDSGLNRLDSCHLKAWFQDCQCVTETKHGGLLTHNED